MRTWVAGIGLLAVALLAVSWWGAGPGALASGAEPGSPTDPLVSRSYVDQFARFQVVSVPTGSRLEARSDGVEVIVRSGRATAVASPAGGLVNVTLGRDMAGGEQVAANHLLIVPRADGRGIEAGSDIVVMVRGPHSIRN